MRLRYLFCSLFLVLPLSIAHADSYVYAINQQFTNFSVNGTFTTDTNFGALGLSDFTNFNLTLSDGVNTDTLTAANADNTALIGTGLTADPNGLYFDFTTPDTTFVLNNTSTGTFFCLQTMGCVANAAGEYVSVDNGATLGQPETGPVQFASFVPTVMPITVTPEPSSLLLLGTGVLGTCASLRRRVLR